MSRLFTLLITFNLILTFSLSSLFVFNLVFPAIKIILTAKEKEKLKSKGLRFNQHKPYL